MAAPRVQKSDVTTHRHAAKASSPTRSTGTSQRLEDQENVALAAALTQSKNMVVVGLIVRIVTPAPCRKCGDLLVSGAYARCSIAYGGPYCQDWKLCQERAQENEAKP